MSANSEVDPRRLRTVSERENRELGRYGDRFIGAQTVRNRLVDTRWVIVFVAHRLTLEHRKSASPPGRAGPRYK